MRKINRTYGPADFDAERGPVVVDKLVFADVAIDPGLYLGEAAFIQELSHSYPTWVGIIDEAVVGASEGERRDLYHHAAIRTYRLAS